MHSTNTTHPIGAKAGADAAQAVGGALRAIEIALVSLLLLLFFPPLLTLTAVALMSTLAVIALVTAGALVFAIPVLVVRRVRAHHRAHASTVFLHRLARRRPVATTRPKETS